jgi:hypothetical protein
VNDFENPDRVVPRTGRMEVGPEFIFEAAPWSLNVVRFPLK